MSIQNELRTFRLRIPVRTRDGQGAPVVCYQDAGTIRAALFKTSAGFPDGEPEVCVERYTALVPRRRAVQPDWQFLDGEDAYTVEEAVSSRRWCVAHCVREARV